MIRLQAGVNQQEAENQLTEVFELNSAFYYVINRMPFMMAPIDVFLFFFKCRYLNATVTFDILPLQEYFAAVFWLPRRPSHPIFSCLI